MAVQSQYNDDNYKNWLKACLGLKYLREGIVDFVDAEVKKLHASILTKVCDSRTCNQCLTNRIVDRRRPQRCPNNVCDKIRKEIEYHHRFTRPCWENTDATKWCTDYWEIGKCFMSQGYATKSKVAETECAGLLTICINGTFLPPSITGQITHLPGLPGAPTDNFHKNRDARNVLLHTASMSITDVERRDYIDDMIKLLTNYKTPVDHVTQAAIDNLIKVNSIDINIIPALELSLLQTKLDAITIRRFQLEEQIQEQCTDYGQSKELIQNNAAALVTLGKRLDELHKGSGEDIADIRKTCTTLQDRTEQIYQRLLEIEMEVKDIDYMKIKVEDHTIEMDTIKKKMDAISADRRYDTCVEDVQDYLISKYKRDTSDVPTSPILRTHCAIVDEIYTELIVRDYLVHKPKHVPESHTIESLYPFAYVETSLSSTTTCRTKSYQYVLFDGQRACKNIYVVGKAGIGKTRWSRKFVTTWLQAIENKRKLQEPKTNENNDDKWKPSENEIILQEYDLVFYIALRHAITDRSVMQMIEHQLFPDRPDLLATARILLNNPDSSSRCIIILDGLDEWCSAEETLLEGETPVRDPTWTCATITTTRAWKLEELQLAATKIDRAVEIQGLDRDGTNRLIDHVVEELNKITAKSKPTSDFRSQISASEQACIQVSLLLTILVCLWHDHIQIDTHRYLAGTYSKKIEMLSAEWDKRKRLFQKLSTDTLAEMKREWDTQTLLPEDCLSAEQVFIKYISFLLRLGKLAFDTLFSKSKESTLVFDYATIKTFLSEEELELSVKIGFLSRKPHPSSALKQEFRFAFLHKTVHEYLAALYMVSGDSQSECVDTYKTHCKTISDILEMENVLLFISGLCPETAGQISCYIAEMRPNEEIHKMLLRCWKASCAVTTTQSPIYIKHHFLTRNSRPEHIKYTLCYLQEETYNNTSISIQSLSRRDLGLDLSTAIDTELQNVSGCHSQQTINRRYPSKRIPVQNDSEQGRIERYTGSTEKLLDLSGCQSLKQLHYTSSEVQILVPDSLEEVQIDRYTGPNERVLDLSRCQSLKKLHYTYSDVRILVPNSLEEVNIDAHSGPAESILDLSKCQSLRKLHYTYSDVQLVVPDSLEEVKIDKYFGYTEWKLDLSRCQSLKTLHYTNSKVQLLVPDSLEEVQIDRYTGPNELVLDLSRCQSLKKLHYTNSNVQILVPDSLEEVKIVRYTGPNEWVLDLSRCQSLNLNKLHYMHSNVRVLKPDR